MIDITAICDRYEIRRLDEKDADSILALCRGNPQFYLYSRAEPTKEQVLSDLRITPPGISLKDKYYIGLYQEGTLAAVMDLVDGYPDPETAYIGFFMMNKDLQGRGEGTAIIRDTAAYLKKTGKAAIRLAIDKGNPQSSRFWEKNGFRVIKEADRNGWTALVAEKKL